MLKTFQLSSFDAEQVAGEDQVAGRGDRQELGEPLDDAEDECVNEVGQGAP